MDWTVNAWIGLRILRWAAWIFFFGFSFYFTLNRAPWLNSFGHLQHFTEALMFFPGLIAIFAGMLELMMRERAGYARPSIGQIWPPRIAR